MTDPKEEQLISLFGLTFITDMKSTDYTDSVARSAAKNVASL